MRREDLFFRFGPPGWNFKNNKLYQFTRKGERGEILIIEGWNEGRGLRAWEKDSANPCWRGSHAISFRLGLNIKVRAVPHANRDGDQLLIPFSSSREVGWKRRKAAYGLFCATIPQPLREAVQPFRGRHLALLRLAARCGQAGRELLESNGTLAYCLSHLYYIEGQRRDHPWRHISSSLLKLRQREILRRLGVDNASEGIVRIMKGVLPSALTLWSIKNLLQLLKGPNLKALHHVAKLGINCGILRLAFNGNLEKVSPAFLAEVAGDISEQHRAYSSYLLEDTLRMFDLIGKRPPIFQSRRKLRAYHDELIDETELIYLRDRRINLEFPEPPLPGIEGVGDPPLTVTPISDALSLLRLATREFRNCAAGDIPEVANAEGRMYFYKASLKQEVAMVLLKKNGIGTYGIKEAAGKFNQSVTGEMNYRLNAWLHGAQQHGLRQV